MSSSKAPKSHLDRYDYSDEIKWFAINDPVTKQPKDKADVIYNDTKPPTHWRHKYQRHYKNDVPTSVHTIWNKARTHWRAMNDNEIRRANLEKSGKTKAISDYKDRHLHFPNQAGKGKFTDCPVCKTEGPGLRGPEAENEAVDAKTGDPGQADAADGSLLDTGSGMNEEIPWMIPVGELVKGSGARDGWKKDGDTGKGKAKEDGRASRSLSPVKKVQSGSAATSRVGSPAAGVKRDSVADGAASKQHSEEEASKHGSNGVSKDGKNEASKDGSNGASKLPIAAKKPDGAFAAAIEEGRRMEEDAVATNRDAKERRRIETLEADHKSMFTDWNNTNEAMQKMKDQAAKDEKEMSRLRRENTEMTKRAQESEKAREEAAKKLKQAEKDLTEANKTANTTKSDLKKAQKNVNDLKSELKDTAEDWEKDIVLKDKAYDEIQVLEEKLKGVANQDAELKEMKTQRDQLVQDLVHVNEMLETTFTAMAKDLSLDEKLKHLREQQQAKSESKPSRSGSRTPSDMSLSGLPKRRPGGPTRHVSLADELANVGEDGNEDEEDGEDGEDQTSQDPPASPAQGPPPQAAQPHLQVPPLQTLGFSGIISQEIVPVAPQPAPRPTLSFSNIITQETAPAAPQQPPRPTLSFSKIISQAISPKKASRKSPTKSEETASAAAAEVPAQNSPVQPTPATATPAPQVVHHYLVREVPVPAPIATADPAPRPTYTDHQTSLIAPSHPAPAAQLPTQPSASYTDRGSSPITAAEAHDPTLPAPRVITQVVAGPTHTAGVPNGLPWLHWAPLWTLGLFALFMSWVAYREQQVWADANDMSGAYDRLIYGQSDAADFALRPGSALNRIGEWGGALVGLIAYHLRGSMG